MAEDRIQAPEPKTAAIRISIAADYAVYSPPDPETAAPLLLALHGWGETCRRFVQPFAPLADRGWLVVAPQAPHPFYVRMAPKKVGFTWLTQYERDRAIAETNQYLAQLLDALHRDYAYDRRRLFLFGFSQGVSTAYRFAVAGLAPIAGLIACCADLPPDVEPALGAQTRFPVLLAHGKDDPLVPAAKAHEAAQILQTKGIPYEHFEFKGGHQLTSELVEQTAAWAAAQTSETIPTASNHAPERSPEARS